MKTVLKWLIGAVLFGNLALAGDFDEAEKKYGKGDYEKAAKLFKQSCDAGVAESCYNLGYMYNNGEGVKYDHFKAVELYKKGCDGGSALGCISLGVSYEFGEGAREDIDKALEYYGKACNMKSLFGCENYARLKK
ncbi:MAG: sel1 repeat family protein [Campylobacteraceae bacterium]|jgi:TPR repeat protein|nr:sel1 repeat family protein [Campylobacteraceae bacterium]